MTLILFVLNYVAIGAQCAGQVVLSVSSAISWVNETLFVREPVEVQPFYWNLKT